MRRPRFSIIMPAYNDGDYIGQAIGSILDQTYESFELIVVDDGSTDNTPNILTGLGEHSRIKVVRQKNGGTASARNTGLRLASGEYIGFLDSDDFYTPDRLAVVNDYLKKNKDVQCIATDHALWDRERLSKPFTEDEPGRLADRSLHLQSSLVFCTLVIRADVFEALGFFDPGFYYIEDVEMWYRLHAHGYSVHFINDCSYCYRRYGDINKTAAANSKGIQRDCVKIDIKYVLARTVPLRMRLQCLRWLMGNVKRYMFHH